MRVDIVWSHRASQQVQQLDEAQRQSLKQSLESLRISPRSGHFYNQVQQAEGGLLTVYVFYGLQVRILYSIVGWIRVRLIIRIEDVSPTDLPGIEEYEERKRR